jgi:hypothetical protein
VPHRTGCVAAALAAAVFGLVTASCGRSTPLRIARIAPNVDASDNGGWQAEVAIASDPRNSRILLAASNSANRTGVRIYSSRDGGEHWLTMAPPLPRIGRHVCGGGDPAVAIDGRGKQFLAFLVQRYCSRSVSNVYLAYRTGPSTDWRISRHPVALTPNGSDEDKPAVAVNTRHGTGVYVTWTRSTLLQNLVDFASSDDGVTWSRAMRVGDGIGTLKTAVASGPNGDVYVVWEDTSSGSLFVTRSRDGHQFTVPQPFAYAEVVEASPEPCGSSEDATPIPAQPHRCVTRGPQMVVDATDERSPGRIYVVYGSSNDRSVQDVHLAVFTPTLQMIKGFPRRVNPSDGRMPSDQFLPAIAVDQSSGDVWICYYDTRGDPSRRRAWFTCTASVDGGKTFLPPLHAATVASNETLKLGDPFEYGEYAGVAATNGIAHPIWTDSRDLDVQAEEIYTTKLTLK